MEYVVFLALALSIFGSMLAAMSALRIHYQEQLFDFFAESDKQIDFIEGRQGEESVADLKKKRSSMSRWFFGWSVFQWMPIALFVLLIAGVVITVHFYDPVFDPNAKKCPKGFVRWSTTILFLVYLGLFLGAKLARDKVRDFAVVIESAYKTHSKGRKSGAGASIARQE
jgi:hypothetical protein